MGQLLAASLSRIFPARFTLYGIRNWLMRSNSINILMVTLNVSSSFISASINLKLKKLTKLKCGVDVKMNSFEESMFVAVVVAQLAERLLLIPEVGGSNRDTGKFLQCSQQTGRFQFQKSAVRIQSSANMTKIKEKESEESSLVGR